MRVIEILNEDGHLATPQIILSNMNRLAMIANEVAAKVKDESAYRTESGSYYKPWAEISRWVKGNYDSGKNMSPDGHSALVTYFVQSARRAGVDLNFEGSVRNARPGQGDSPVQIFGKLVNFYTEVVPKVAQHVSSISDSQVHDIQQKSKMLDKSVSNLLQQIQQFEKEKQSYQDAQVADEYADIENDEVKQLKGDQIAQVEQLVYSTLSDIAKKYGKEVAHNLRTVVNKSGDKLKSLQQQMQQHGIVLDESIMLQIHSFLQEG